MKLSIVVATYKRPTLLKKVLDSLRAQRTSGVEVVVIENTNGLAKARNMGWRSAKGEYVAYIDDDAIASPHWVASIMATIKTHPEMQCFGGPYTRYASRELPMWMPKTYGSMSHGKRIKILAPGEWLSGTNMVIKRSLLKRMGGFSPSLGMEGHKIGYGEEIELQAKILENGLDIYYLPKMTVRHLISERKMQFWQAIRDAYARGVGMSKIKKTHTMIMHRIRKVNHNDSRPSSALSLGEVIYHLLSLVSYGLGIIQGKLI